MKGKIITGLCQTTYWQVYKVVLSIPILVKCVGWYGSLVERSIGLGIYFQ